MLTDQTLNSFGSCPMNSKVLLEAGVLGSGETGLSLGLASTACPTKGIAVDGA